MPSFAAAFNKVFKWFFQLLIKPNWAKKAVDKFSKQLWAIARQSFRKGASVRASQQFEDLELIHRSQAGDSEAFGELVIKVCAMIYSIVGDENEVIGPISGEKFCGF